MNDTPSLPWREMPGFDGLYGLEVLALTDTEVTAKVAVVAEAEEQLGAEGLAAATWIIVTINAWNRVAIASHTEAGHYEPGE